MMSIRNNAATVRKDESSIARYLERLCRRPAAVRSDTNILYTNPVLTAFARR